MHLVSLNLKHLGILFLFETLSFFPPPLMSAPVAADPAKSGLGGLWRGRVRGAGDPISSWRLPRAQRKPSAYNLILDSAEPTQLPLAPFSIA